MDEGRHQDKCLDMLRARGSCSPLLDYS